MRGVGKFFMERGGGSGVVGVGGGGGGGGVAVAVGVCIGLERGEIHVVSQSTSTCTS